MSKSPRQRSERERERESKVENQHQRLAFAFIKLAFFSGAPYFFFHFIFLSLSSRQELRRWWRKKSVGNDEGIRRRRRSRRKRGGKVEDFIKVKWFIVQKEERNWVSSPVAVTGKEWNLFGSRFLLLFHLQSNLVVIKMLIEFDFDEMNQKNYFSREKKTQSGNSPRWYLLKLFSQRRRRKKRKNPLKIKTFL